MPAVITGISFHAIGAASAALCYTPQKKTKGWAWQTFWLAQAAMCWFILPVLVAWITIPDIVEVLLHSPVDAMKNTFLLGAAYGIGGTAFGIAIRYVGFSLTYAIAVGISCVFGTLIPPIVHGTLDSILQNNGSVLVISGIVTGAVGILFCGIAGRSKEVDIEKNLSQSSAFSLAKGLPLCFLAGLLSAVYGFAIDIGHPIAEVAVQYGAGNFQSNIIYVFSNTGAFVSTAVYCIYLHFKQKTFTQYKIIDTTLPRKQLLTNNGLAALTGLLWFGQFFFYGLAHVQMGKYQFTSWAIHMIMLVLFSTITGMILKEWMNCSRKTIRLLLVSLFVLVSAVILLSYGNYLGSVA